MLLPQSLRPVPPPEDTRRHPDAQNPVTGPPQQHITPDRPSPISRGRRPTGRRPRPDTSEIPVNDLTTVRGEQLLFHEAKQFALRQPAMPHDLVAIGPDLDRDDRLVDTKPVRTEATPIQELGHKADGCPNTKLLRQLPGRSVLIGFANSDGPANRDLMVSREAGHMLGPSMHEEPPVSITAHRYGDPVQQAPADGLTTKHDGRFLVLLVDLLNPLIHEQTIAVTSDNGLPSSWAIGFSGRRSCSSSSPLPPKPDEVEGRASLTNSKNPHHPATDNRSPSGDRRCAAGISPVPPWPRGNGGGPGRCYRMRTQRRPAPVPTSRDGSVSSYDPHRTAPLRRWSATGWDRAAMWRWAPHRAPRGPARGSTR